MGKSQSQQDFLNEAIRNQRELLARLVELSKSCNDEANVNNLVAYYKESIGVLLKQYINEVSSN